MTSSPAGKPVDPLHLSPSELISRCIESGDASAWEELVRRYRTTIALVVLPVARRWNESSTLAVDDLVQETFLKVCENDCRILREFRSEHRDGLAGFLKVIAANLAQDHFKSLHTLRRGAGVTRAMADDLTQVHRDSGDTAERLVLFRQIDDYVRELCTKRQRDEAVFWLYYREGMTASAIASIPSFGLTTKGVESIIFRLTQNVRSRFGFTPPRTASRRMAEGI
jgi:RNA polymerase sigma-70 factor (ECF subfamily)